VPEFQTSPGMRDILPPDSARWRRFVEVFAEVADGAGYGQVISPLLEDLGVFQRIGAATDVVSKEMYDFVDKGGRHIALRPELTASVCRAFVQHHPVTPWKVWYTGSQFRYEKPQRGRYRQFDQVGIEVLGANDPYLDVEIIALGWEFFRRLGLRPGALRRSPRGLLPGAPRRPQCREPGHPRQEPAARARLEATAGCAGGVGRAPHRRVLQR
jgi:histidyl-tRNA synthetase